MAWQTYICAWTGTGEPDVDPFRPAITDLLRQHHVRWEADDLRADATKVAGVCRVRADVSGQVHAQIMQSGGVQYVGAGRLRT